jgi:hypothetical protein
MDDASVREALAHIKADWQAAIAARDDRALQSHIVRWMRKVEVRLSSPR